MMKHGLHHGVHTDSKVRATPREGTAHREWVVPSTNGVDEMTPEADGHGGLRVPEAQNPGAGMQGGLWVTSPGSDSKRKPTLNQDAKNTCVP